MTRDEDELENEDDSTASQASGLALAPPAPNQAWIWFIFAIVFVVMCVWAISEFLALRYATQLSQTRNILKQLGLATQNFHDTYHHFPPAQTIDTRGTRLQTHSWVTALGPYMDASPLYSQIILTETWNSPANRAQFATPLHWVINPALSAPDTKDGYGVAHYAWNSQLLTTEPSGRGIQVREIRDGTSQTMLIGTVTSGIKPWADPSNVRDPAEGIGASPTQFNPVVREGVQLLLADGSVRTISADIDPAVFHALGTPSGGEAVDTSQW